MIYPYHNKKPNIDPSVFIGDHVVITGDVTIGPDSSVFYNTVIRGDVSPTIIGSKVNVQDLCCLHQSPGRPLVLEDEVTIGHQVTLHSCHVKKGALIGMASIVLDGAEIGEGAFIGAGSLVTQGKVIPPNTMAFGRPAKVVRELTDEDKKDMVRIINEYHEKGQFYKSVQQNSER
ncbi:gamma carbonic anhydrase family protein [Rummeliibacillus sp. G93]|uniref:gamma carbonic anhydrase n=1 Tax=Rummeliibacillus TaxID=648802 RepID=UPI0011724181|nr:MULTISPECIES: gamma carbonic anhydrase family protein [Rummeliibacillus]MBB5168659.1 carbonic anhydrase/acetyltransferase-like protein (isoleucine patch superfamily) [Rummeliibacillus stabekisii]UQW96559.1 gamma carbonic anhydrase family protein [Rummeliibacillus sp. G93]GEL05203.1 gamma carbonic anhydrase family protein [Rummeliibacillus stabekisii]